MRHHFEEWYEKLHYKEQITNSVKELFEESVKCHKAGVYRSAIVMGFTGFCMIIKDRVYFYRHEIKKETKLDNKKDNIEIEDGDFQDENSWDSEFNKTIIDAKESRFSTIFEGQSDFRKGWIYWRAHRNTGAHGKSYVLNNSDVESLYSWIKQAENSLHPFVSYKIWLDHLNNILSINNINTISNFNNIALGVNKLTQDNQWDEFYIILETIIKNTYPEYPNKIIEFIEELYNIETNKIFQFIDKHIIKKDGLNKKVKSKFLTDFALKRPFYTAYIDEKEKNKLIEYINDITILDILANIDTIKSIKKQLEIIDLKNINFYSLANIRGLVEIEITRRCIEISKDVESIEKYINKIPLDQLTEAQVKLIIKSINKNNGIYKKLISDNNDFIKYYGIWKTNYTNIDYTKIDKLLFKKKFK